MGRPWGILAVAERGKLVEASVANKCRREQVPMMTLRPGHRVAMAIGLATAMVLVIALLIPRGYIANDDIGLVEYLRANTLTPWISPILSRTLGLAYAQAPSLPWWGLYLYGLIVVTGAVLFHTCAELIERRPGLERKATWLGAVVIGASHAILVVGITWTTVSIAALGTALAAFVAHAQLCQAAGRPMSWPRALIYGVLFVNGYMLRPQGLFAVLVTLTPLLGWTTWRFVQRRYRPQLGALIALCAPFMLVFAIQDHIPAARDEDMHQFDRFNDRRGRLNGQAAFERLDERAPELLARAGWTRDEYRDFVNWLIIDEDDYPPEKLERLLATGGVPEKLTLEWGYRQLRDIVDESAASVYLFLSVLAAGVVMALSGMIERRRGLAFCLGYLAYLIGVPLWMAAHLRFPQRVSLSMYTVAALGAFLFLVGELADRPAVAAPLPRKPAIAGLSVVGLLLLGWAWNLIGWLHREPPANRDTLQAFDEHVAARGGFVFVYIQAGLVELDPLRARPRGYDGLQGGWGTFSTLWYDTIKQLGVHRGADVFHAMLDNSQAYLLAPQGARRGLEEWIRRKVGNPSVRLALVDGAAILDSSRPELYHLVTTPLVRDSDEWRMMERDERARMAALPGPPSVRGLAFRSITFAAPYEQHASRLHRSGDHATVEPVGGGVRCSVTDDTRDGCTVTGDDGPYAYAGVHAPIRGLRAARFEIKLIDPENIVDVNVRAQSMTSRSVGWRWQLSPQVQPFDYAGTFTLVPGYPAHQLALADSTAKAADLRDLHVFITVKPGTQAGFELKNLEVSEP